MERALPVLLELNRVPRSVVYRSPWVARLLFGCRLVACGGTSFWELGSLAMRKALRRYLRDGMRVLEIGTGPYAILPLWSLSRWELSVTATDVEGRWVDWARRMIARNARLATVITSDMFSAVEGRFDLIWFFPPAYPEATLRTHPAMREAVDAEQARLLATRSCGGRGGWELIDRFYRHAAGHLADGGRTLVAVNDLVQPDSRIRGIVARHGFELEEEIGLSLVPYRVYVARRAASVAQEGPASVELQDARPRATR